MKPLSFLQWSDQMLENTPGDFKIECPDCDGLGETECCECGNMKECHECDEDGKVRWSELEHYQRRNYLTMQRYTEAVAKDLRAVSDWLSKPFEPMMIDAGFAVYCDIATRRSKFAFVGATP